MWNPVARVQVDGFPPPEFQINRSHLRPRDCVLLRVEIFAVQGEEFWR